jgi:hypothetical protein
MNHDWYAAAKTFREKRRQHDDLKCGEAHPRKSHSQWGRELTEMWETHRGIWRRTRRKSTAGDHGPDDQNTYCEVVHPGSSHEEWFDQHTWTEPGTGRSFYYRAAPQTGNRRAALPELPSKVVTLGRAIRGQSSQKREAVRGDGNAKGAMRIVDATWTLLAKAYVALILVAIVWVLIMLAINADPNNGCDPGDRACKLDNTDFRER